MEFFQKYEPKLNFLHLIFLQFLMLVLQKNDKLILCHSLIKIQLWKMMALMIHKLNNQLTETFLNPVFPKHLLLHLRKIKFSFIYISTKIKIVPFFQNEDLLAPK